MKRLFLSSFLLLSFIFIGTVSGATVSGGDYGDLYVMELRSNDADFGPLRSFVEKYSDVINSGKASIHVTAYTNTALLSSTNSVLAKDMVDTAIKTLKSYGVPDKYIVSDGFSGKYDGNNMVVITIGIPKGMGKGTASSYNPAVSAALPVVTSVSPVVAAPTVLETPAPAPVQKVKVQEPWGLEGLYLRTNMLFLVALTPNAGIEWRYNEKHSVLVNGGWADWKWDDGMRNYSTWYVLPEYRWYLGSHRRWYVGVQGQYGDLDIMVSTDGYKGEFYGGSVTGGYNLPIGRRLSLDFNLGLGYTTFKHDKYEWETYPGSDVMVRVRTETDLSSNLIGPNQIGVNLVWHISR